MIYLSRYFRKNLRSATFQYGGRTLKVVSDFNLIMGQQDVKTQIAPFKAMASNSRTF